MVMKWILPFLFLLPFTSTAQCLKQSVSIDCSPCSLDQLIEQIEGKLDCSFSYNSSSLASNEKDNYSYDQVSVRRLLNDALPNRFEVKERGRHILIIEKRVKKETKSKQKSYLIEGTVRNAETGQVVRNATIYTVGDKYSTLTDEGGNYQISLTSEAV